MVEQPRGNKDGLDKDHGAAFGMEDAGELGVGKAISDFKQEFKQLDYGFLVPFKKIFSQELLRKKAVRWVLLFGLLPLLFPWLASNFRLDFVEVLWLIELYFCLFWALYFYSIINPSREIWKRGVGYAAFTALVGIPLLLGSQSIPFIQDLYEGTASRDLGARVIGFVFGVGVLEELCKALPLLIFGLRKKTLHGVRDGVFLGLLSGFGFAAAEGVQYTVGASVMALEYGSVSNQVLVLLDRVITGPLQHGAWAGVVGWFIGVASRREGAKWPIVTVGIALMALLHGLYDAFSGGLIGIALAAVGYLAFMGYLIHGESEKVSQNVDASVAPADMPHESDKGEAR